MTIPHATHAPAAFGPRFGNWVLAAISLAATFAVGSWPGDARAQSLKALTTFGSNGWVVPQPSAPYTTTGTANNTRGLAFNPVTGNLVIASRQGGNNVQIWNATTGTQTGTLGMGGVTGGAGAVINMVGVASDGAIYVGNLTTTASELFKVYRWADETPSINPTVAFSGTLAATVSGTLRQISRIGDSLAVSGSGNSTLIAAAGNSSNTSVPVGANSNSNFAVLSYASGTATSTAFMAVPGTVTTNGNNDYRLSLTFVDSDTLIGKSAASGTARLSDFSIGSGTANALAISGLTNWTQLSYREIDSKPYLAAINVTNNRVGVFSLSSGTVATLLTQFTTTVGGTISNGNGTGATAWGVTTQPDPASPWYYETTLYAMNTNNGVQAMVFSVPEPATWAMLPAGIAACGGGAYLRSRSRRRRRAA